MRVELFSLLLLFSVSPGLCDAKKDYSGYALIRITPSTDEQVYFLKELWENNELEVQTEASNDKSWIGFWKPPTRIGVTVDVNVSPVAKENFLNLLSERAIPYATELQNLENAIENEKNAPSRQFAFDSKKKSFFLDEYHRFAEIEAYLEDLEYDHPKLVRVENIGTSHERRPILVVKISSPARERKPAIWVDGGMHAREWISPATVLYFIDKLATTYDTDPEIEEMVSQADWYFLPVANPDGYDYTHTSDRMWRKNRSPQKCTRGWFSRQCCEGVDLNRNFEWHHGGAGASSSPCSEVYAGPQAFSEPETRAIQEFISDRRQQIKAYITLHSYAQIWIYPYGHRERSYPENLDKLHSVASAATRALRSVHRTSYSIGTGADTLYPASGGSDDWAKGKAMIPLSYLLELRPNQGFGNGFILPETQIIPTGEETWQGLKVVAKEVIQEFGGTMGGRVTESVPEIRPVTFAPRPGPFPRTVTTRPFIPRPTSRPKTRCRDRQSFCPLFVRVSSCSWRRIRRMCKKTCNACDDDDRLFRRIN